MKRVPPGHVSIDDTLSRSTGLTTAECRRKGSKAWHGHSGQTAQFRGAAQIASLVPPPGVLLRRV